MMQRLRSALPLFVVLTTAGCGSVAGSSTTPSRVTTSSGPVAPSGPTTQWPVYHLTPSHAGNDAGEPSFAHLKSAWTTDALDGAVYAEPLLAGGSVLVATENDSLYAFDATSGAPRWHVTVGTPRTSNFPCGNIMPLGITGTPVIDGGYLYAVAEVENSAGVYRFNLVKVDVTTGNVVYNMDITPAGMNTNNEQERGALAISNGAIVVSWGGLIGDCGSYHGYVESVSEASGRSIALWNDTPNDNEGGLWAASGPAVDAAGNIYVATGNGSTTDPTQYDWSDSVVKLSPSLAVLSFFAPGPPQTWTSLNGSDTDLGSAGPVLLDDGLLFQAGKGGRGYVLAQAQLPGISNPGGGENASADVCNGGLALGGMAAADNVVYVPCSNGITAVRIDSSTRLHVLWNSVSGSSAPIVAGGLVWSLNVGGGSDLVGLDPASGSVVSTLHLPQDSQHFATPSAGEGRLYVGAGDRVAAFAPG
jgi:outer membrane protein assembly factor BamB